MSRKAVSGGDSLDLLLDTICNTFGGILFIAMLVAILTSQINHDAAPSVPGAESTRNLRGLRTEITRSESRLTKLRQAVRQKEDLERQFADPETLGLLNSLRSLDDNSDALLKERTEKLTNVAESQAELEETARELVQLARLMADAKERLQQEKERLEQEAILRSRTSEVPQQRATEKIAIPCFLKAGRFSCFARRNRDGQIVQNEAESKLVEEAPEEKYIELVPGAGLTVAADGSNVDQFAARLADFDNTQHFLSVFVYKDSFASFESVKNEMIRKGFEYHLVPFPDDAKVYIGDETEKVLVQ